MTEIPRFWRLRGPLLRLEGSNCPNCKIRHFPAREICPDCGYTKNEFNRNYRPAKNYFQSPESIEPENDSKKTYPEEG